MPVYRLITGPGGKCKTQVGKVIEGNIIEKTREYIKVDTDFQEDMNDDLYLDNFILDLTQRAGARVEHEIIELDGTRAVEVKNIERSKLDFFRQLLISHRDKRFTIGIRSGFPVEKSKVHDLYEEVFRQIKQLIDEREE